MGHNDSREGLSIARFFNAITAPPGLIVLPDGTGVVECDEDERARFKAYVEYEQHTGLPPLPARFRLLRRWEQGNLGIWRQTNSYLTAQLP